MSGYAHYNQLGECSCLALSSSSRSDSITPSHYLLFFGTCHESHYSR